MAKSPLARVIAPTPLLRSYQMNTIEAIADRVVAAPKSFGKADRPNFGAFIDLFCLERRLNFIPYVDTDAEVRLMAATITKALAKRFPEWEVTERIESATYKPPFAVSWDFAPKKGAAK